MFDVRCSRLQRKRLFIPVVIVLIILVAYNVLIHFAARKTQRQRLLGAIDHLPASTECIFLGNSLIEAGGDTAAFQSAWSHHRASPVTVNLGLGATTPVEHYVILKRAFSRNVHIKYVVYGFFDDQLNASASGNWDDLIGNRAFSYYFPEDTAALYSPNSRLAAWKMEATACIPMLAERSSLWDKVELFRRRLEQIGMPKVAVNRFGRVADFTSLEASDAPDFTRRCDAIVHGRKTFSPAIQAMISLAHDHGARFYLVEMPMSPQHLRTFYSLPVWAQMRGYLESLADREQVTYIAASDWIPNSADFEDSVHLNEEGARSFSARLGAVLSRSVAASPIHTMAGR